MNEGLLVETRAPAPLHQCRVALRRLRTALSLFKDVIADEDVEKLKTRLRAFTQKLGVARDLDVYLGKLNELREEGAPDSDEVIRRVQRDREHAYDGVIAALHGKGSQGLMFDILAWSEAGPWLSSRDEAPQARREEPIECFAAEVLDSRTRKIKKRARHLQELDPPARHNVRIEAKKLRYATEFFASLATTKKHRKRHEAFSTALVALQEHLGELNDLAAGDNLARTAAEQAGTAPEAGAPSGDGKAAKNSLKAAASAFRRIAKAKPFWRFQSDPDPNR